MPHHKNEKNIDEYSNNKAGLNSVPEFIFIDNISYIMENLFQIPGTRFKFGLDPLLGFFPVIGDAISALISTTTIFAVIRHKVSQKVLILMAGNILFDFIVGSIPLLGDIFDFFYKPNQRNLKILREHLEVGKHQGSGRGLIIGFLLFLITIIILTFIIFWQLISYLINYISNIIG